MAVGLSPVNMANAILNIYRGTTFTGIATPFIQLHTADPGVNGTTAVSVGSTTRNAITWNAASAGSMTLATLGAWTNGGTSETITHVTLWSASSAGTFYQSFALTASQAWVSTNTLTITTFTINYAPLAA
jgi:hypothetical protein